MKVVIAHRTGTVHVVDLPDPGPQRGCVLVRVTHSALSVAEELAQIAAMPGLQTKEDGRPIGSGVSGVIESVGEDVKRLRGGLRVAAFGAPYVFHSERLVIPENLVVELPKKVNHEEGAFVGQGATALNMVRRSGIQLGESAIVFGADLMGMLIAQTLRAAGASVVLLDPVEHRLTRARAVGISSAVSPDDADELMRLLVSVAGEAGPDAAFITRADDALALSAAAELVRPRGTILIGAPMHRALLPEAVTARGLSIVCADDPGAGRGDVAFERHGFDYPREHLRWNERENMACFAALLADRKVQISPLVSDRTPIERAPSLYEKAARSPETVLGAVLTL